MPESAQIPWLQDLIASANSLAEELGLDDGATQRLRDFVITKARDQYRAGNKSGIRWARSNPPRA